MPWSRDAALLIHAIFEALAYATGFWVYRRLRRHAGDPLGSSDRWAMIVAVVLGAVIGSKILHHLAHPDLLARHWREPLFLLGGKTIVGGLLGGLIAVEWTKKRKSIQRSTGDLYAIPLCVGIAIGRIGCFMAGVHDDTWGQPSDLAWAMDGGDGILRHPTPLYELVFLAILGWRLWRRSRWPHPEGDLFAAFMIAYLGFRFAIDFLKPREIIGGLGLIQWACLGGLLHYAFRALGVRPWQHVSGPGSTTTPSVRSVQPVSSSSTASSSSKTTESS